MRIVVRFQKGLNPRHMNFGELGLDYQISGLTLIIPRAKEWRLSKDRGTLEVNNYYVVPIERVEQVLVDGQPVYPHVAVIYLRHGEGTRQLRLSERWHNARADGGRIILPGLVKDHEYRAEGDAFVLTGTQGRTLSVPKALIARLVIDGVQIYAER